MGAFNWSGCPTESNEWIKVGINLAVIVCDGPLPVKLNELGETLRDGERLTEALAETLGDRETELLGEAERLKADYDTSSNVHEEKSRLQTALNDTMKKYAGLEKQLVRKIECCGSY